MLNEILGIPTDWPEPPRIPSWQWIQSEDFKRWSAEVHPTTNVYAYLEMVEEREKATRLEF